MSGMCVQDSLRMPRAAGHKAASPWGEHSPQQHPGVRMNGAVPAPACPKSPGSVGDLAANPAEGQEELGWAGQGCRGSL